MCVNWYNYIIPGGGKDISQIIKNKIQLFTIIIISLFVLTACGNSSTSSISRSSQNDGTSAITKTKDLKNNISDLRNLTPAKVLEEYINSLKDGNAKEINALLSEKYLTTIDNGNGYKAIQKQKISNVEIKIDNKKPSTDNEAYYILSFLLEDESDPPFFMSGKGKYTYFIKLVNSDNCWRIDGLATSP